MSSGDIFHAMTVNQPSYLTRVPILCLSFGGTSCQAAASAFLANSTSKRKKAKGKAKAKAKKAKTS